MGICPPGVVFCVPSSSESQLGALCYRSISSLSALLGKPPSPSPSPSPLSIEAAVLVLGGPAASPLC